jgi:hypothetical protein
MATCFVLGWSHRTLWPPTSPDSGPHKSDQRHEYASAEAGTGAVALAKHLFVHMPADEVIYEGLSLRIR